MKRICSLILILSLALALGACTQNSSDFDQPVSFYYLQSSMTHGSADSVIAAELREGSIYGSETYAFLEAYLLGPETPALTSPFPSGTTLIYADIYYDTLYITLDDSFAQLTGIDMTLACACITKTCLEFTDVLTVQIRAENELLDGRQYISMDADSLLLLDNSGNAATETESED